MASFIFKLAVGVIPLFVLVASATGIAALSDWYTRHPLSWHRRRHRIMRALAGGVQFR